MGKFLFSIHYGICPCNKDAQTLPIAKTCARPYLTDKQTSFFSHGSSSNINQIRVGQVPQKDQCNYCPNVTD